jgi:hypothetical protein
MLHIRPLSEKFIDVPTILGLKDFDKVTNVGIGGRVYRPRV